MSAAAVFAEIVAAGWAGVSDWHKQNKEETLHLEFKRQSDIKTTYNDKDRGSLAKSIAGFANVEGGVVIFGVHAKDMGKKPDMVQSICAFDDIAEVGSRIDRDLPNLTDPPVPGLRIEKITDPANPNSGVIAIFVQLAMVAHIELLRAVPMLWIATTCEQLVKQSICLILFYPHCSDVVLLLC